MSFPFFIASRIHFAKADGTQRVSPPAIRIATLSIAIGLAVMLVTVAIVVGFKQEVRNKISDFGGHIQVLAMASNRTYEKLPICYSDSLLSALSSLPEVSHVQPFITKPSVIKTERDFLCVVAKSGSDNGMIISETIARKLQLQVGDKVKLYFIEGTDNRAVATLAYGSGAAVGGKVRTLTVTGLYQTHFNEYDSQVVIVPRDMLCAVNSWDDDMASGIEIRLRDFDLIYDGYVNISQNVSLTQDRRGTQYMVQGIEQQNPQIFAWLDLLDTNVWVILALMVAVSSFTMISGLMIIILERRHMIGVFKAMGSSNRQLRHIFIYLASFLVIRGLFWGNLIGLGLCIIQYFLHPIALDPENYYLEFVPISINLWHIFALNAGTLLITILVLLVPSGLVAHISPTRTLQAE